MAKLQLSGKLVTVREEWIGCSLELKKFAREGCSVNRGKVISPYTYILVIRSIHRETVV